ncbi:MAG: DNA helicase RecQ [Chloroflexi bacterium]|nr:DNA helicase RecQ [Chloroflexota bacterium]
MTTADLQVLLKRHFGYDQFRPGQEEIISNALAGRNSLVVMPTGGGKSLCYQLPALATGGVTLVISPLIALMKDQVDGLRSNGIAADFLNSTLDNRTAAEVERGAQAGAVRLLYVAPERVSMPGFRRFLGTLDLRMIAIDEAHCISEWGHDFRPDYRTLAELRALFPQTPVMALTATATERVQRDIVEQLRLDDCRRFVSGFDRPNLTYRVEPGAGASDALLDLLEERKGQSAIIYCFSRKDTEELANRLTSAGHPAVAYHAGLDTNTRRLTQERFIDGDVPIVAATIAFGMGIDKPDIRLVVHHALPKSIEAYYQETGRAGRDGLPSECVLFFNEGDRAKQEYFIQSMTGEARAVAERQLQQMVDFCRLSTCRRRYLLQYFGETETREACGNCDTCLAQRQEVDVTVVAQKVMSAVIRTGERFGFAHVGNVLLGKNLKRVRELEHDKLTVFGIVDDYDHDGLRRVADGLVDRGLLSKAEGKYATLSLTREGRVWLRGHDPLTLELRIPEATKRAKPSRTGRGGAVDTVDSALFDRLRALRRRLADEENVPAFVVFGDVTLRGLAAAMPVTTQDMLRVSGVGPAKLERYGEAFLTVIRGHVNSIPPASVDNVLPVRGNVGTPRSTTGHIADDRRLTDTHNRTHQLLQQGLTIAEIATSRGLTHGTVMAHVERIVKAGKTVDLTPLLPARERTERIATALQVTDSDRLAPVKELLGDDYSYDEIRLVRLALQEAKV